MKNISSLLLILMLIGLMQPLQAASDADDVLDFLPGIITAAMHAPPVVSPPPVMPPGVTLLSTYTTKRDSLGKLIIVGEVYNNTSSNIRLVNVSANIYNQGQLVMTGEASVYRDIMPPQSQSCFTMYTAYTGPFTVVLFQPVSYSLTAKQAIKLPISGVNTQSNPIGGFNLSGWIRNTTGRTIELTSAIGTFYDNQGKVTGCEVGFVNSGNNSVLSPNQVGSFTMGVSVSPASVEDYILQSDYQ